MKLSLNEFTGKVSGDLQENHFKAHNYRQKLVNQNHFNSIKGSLRS